jgi:hypothetical protein
MIDTSRSWVPVEIKYGRKYQGRNVCAVYASTNETAAIALEDDDRRVLVVLSEAVPWPARRYHKLAAWLEGGGQGLVVQWLVERWERIGEARRAAVVGNAPVTAGKREMFLAGDQVRAWVAERIEEGGADWPDVMTAAEVVANVRRGKANVASGLTSRAHEPSVIEAGRLLAGLGAVRLLKGAQLRLDGGEQVRLWAVRDGARFASMDTASLREVVKAQRAFGEGAEAV